MTALEEDILFELCQTRVTRSAVVLAEDLCARGRLSEIGDPFGLVAWTLEGLNKKSLVKYRLGYGQVPVEIRVSPAGFVKAGYPIQYAQAGNRRRVTREQDAARHPGDATDFSNLADQTWGSEIERMPIREHCIKWFDHAELHNGQLAELVERQKEVTHMPGTHLGPEVLEGIARTIAGNPDITDASLAERYGVSSGTVRNIRTATLERDGARDRLLRFIVRHGPFKSVHDIDGRAVALNYHESTHILFRLRRAALVTFTEDKRHNTISNIAATRLGVEQDTRHAAVYDEVQLEVPMSHHGEPSIYDGVKPETREIAKTIPTAVVPRTRSVDTDGRPLPELEDILAGMPLLAALVDRDRALAPMRQAAKLLEGAGKEDLALRVMEEANDLSPIEVEIVAFIKQELVSRRGR